jgi:hypothetical protein
MRHLCPRLLAPALRELKDALDTLKADGIGLLWSNSDKWLGHAQSRRR